MAPYKWKVTPSLKINEIWPFVDIINLWNYYFNSFSFFLPLSFCNLFFILFFSSFFSAFLLFFLGFFFAFLFLFFFLFVCVFLCFFSQAKPLLPLPTHFVEISSHALFQRFPLCISPPSSSFGIKNVSWVMNQKERKKWEEEERVKIQMKNSKKKTALLVRKEVRGRN